MSDIKIDAPCTCGHSASAHVEVEDAPNTVIHPCATPGCHCWNYREATNV